MSIRYVCVCGCRDTLNKLQNIMKRHKIPWIELEKEGEQKYMFCAGFMKNRPRSIWVEDRKLAGKIGSGQFSQHLFKFVVLICIFAENCLSLFNPTLEIDSVLSSSITVMQLLQVLRMVWEDKVNCIRPLHRGCSGLHLAVLYCNT